MSKLLCLLLFPFLISCGSDNDDAVSELRSICGKTTDFIPINKYKGGLSWVQKREGAVGRLRAGNAACSGTFIGNHNGKKNLFLTAGHCLTKGIPAKVEFNYEDNPDGPSVTISGVALESSTNPDYALVRLDSRPNISPTPLGDVTKKLAMIQHPAARPKVIAVGKLLSNSNPDKISYSIDSLGGSSGSGILNDSGSLVGVHVNGGCTATGGANSGWTISSIRKVSSIL